MLITLPRYKQQDKTIAQKALLPQRDCMMRYVSKFFAMFHELQELEAFQTAKVTFKVIGHGAVQWATYDFLLVFYCD